MVSVIIPVCCSSPFLSRAIRSALDQTFPDVEVIVIYRRGLSYFLWQLASQHFLGKRVQPLKETRQAFAGMPAVRFLSGGASGLAALLNEGVAAARGDFICWLNPEDCLLPYKIEDQLNQMEALPRGDVCYSDAYLVTGEFIFRYHQAKEKEALPRANLILSSTLMIRRSALKKVGSLQPRYAVAPEFHWLLLASQSCAFRYLDYPTVKVDVSNGLRFLARHVNREEKRIVLDLLRSGFYVREPALALSLAKRGLTKEAQTVAKEVCATLPDAEASHLRLLANWKKIMEGCCPPSDDFKGMAWLKAWAAAKQGNLSLLEKELARANWEELPSPDLAWETASHLMRQGRYDLALPLFERLSELFPDNPEGYRMRSHCLFNLGRFRPAITLATEAINKGAGTPQAYDLLARSLAVFGWLESAEEVWKLGIKANPLNPSAHLRFATHYLFQNRADLVGQHLGLIFSPAFVRAIGKQLKRWLVTLAIKVWLKPLKEKIGPYSLAQLVHFFMRYEAK